MDLYSALGVARDATQAAIKQAYRKMAKQHHPDVGGDAEKFGAIATAYDVLGDEEKRRKYDETGEVPGAAKSENADALAIINQLVDGLTQEIILRDGLEHRDLVAELVKKVDEQIASTLADRKEAEKFEKKATKLRARFSAKTGPDYVGQMLDARIASCVKAIEAAARGLMTLEKARKLLLDAEFKVEPRSAPADPFQGLGGIQGSSLWKTATYRGL